MKKLIPMVLLVVVWSRPDGGISITTVIKGTSQEEAVRLKAIGDIPADWEAVAYDVVIPSTRGRRNHWRWDRNTSSIKDDLPNPVNPVIPRTPRSNQ